MAENGTLAGKLALVTGVDAGGIGQGIALELARQGAAVVAHYPYTAEGAQATVEEIQADGGRATAVQGDLSEVETCFRVVREATDFLGGLDILINNSGVTEQAKFLDVTPQLFDKLFHINIRSHVFCAQEAVRAMQERGGGSIINLASIHAFGGVPSYSIYASTKGAIVGFTRQLAIELTGQHIRVNALAPGLVEVPRHRNDPSYSHEWGNQSVPWGRVGEPGDIAQAAAFLVSDAADFITGQVLYVDGGTTAKLAFPTR